MSQSVDREFASNVPSKGARFGPPIVFQGQLTLKHEERAFRLTAHSLWIFRIAGLAAGGFAAMYFLKWWIDDDPKFGLGVVVGQLFGAILLFHFDRVVIWIASLTARGAGYPASRDVTLTIDETGVVAQTAAGVSRHTWQQLDHLIAGRDLIVLRSRAAGDTTCLVIPREFAANASDWSRLTSYVLTGQCEPQRRPDHAAPGAAPSNRRAHAPQPSAGGEESPVVLDGVFGWRQQVLVQEWLRPPFRHIVAICLMFYGSLTAIGLLMSWRNPAAMVPAVLTTLGALVVVFVFTGIPQIARSITRLAFRLGIKRPERITWTFTSGGMRKVTRMGDLASLWSDLLLAGRSAEMIVLYSPSRMAFEFLLREFAAAEDWERLESLVAEQAMPARPCRAEASARAQAGRRNPLSAGSL